MAARIDACTATCMTICMEACMDACMVCECARTAGACCPMHQVWPCCPRRQAWPRRAKTYVEFVVRQLQAHFKQQEQHAQLAECLKILWVAHHPARQMRACAHMSATAAASPRKRQ
eukprot:282538-Chlamydomonas_euryale.AAC.1